MVIDWEMVGAIGEILGAVAVVATLVYLIRELEHTQSSSVLTTGEQVLRAFDEGNRLMVVDEPLRQVLYKQGALSEPERLQLYMFAVMKCNMWLSAQNAYDRGQISDELYAGASKDVRIVLEDWPALLDSFLTWLDRYPEVSAGAIFDPLREAADDGSHSVTRPGG